MASKCSSRPASAARSVTSERSHRAGLAGMSSTYPAMGLLRRPESARTQRPQSARSQRPQSAGTRPHPIGLNYSMRNQPVSPNMRVLEEELEPPPLSPVPVGLATELEKQLAEVLGLGSQQAIPRLPREVIACSHGSKCCWRWLARASLEQVAGMPAEKLGLSNLVGGLREELDFLRREQKVRNDDKERVENAEADLVTLRNTNAKIQEELHGLRPLQKEMVRLQTESAELRVINGRLEAQEEAALREVARLKSEQAAALESGLAAARVKEEGLERTITKATSDEQARLEQIDGHMKELKQQKTEIEHLKAKVAAEQAAKKRLKRVLRAERLKAKLHIPNLAPS